MERSARSEPPGRRVSPDTVDARGFVDARCFVNARCFVDLAQAVSQAVRACGLAPPGFQTLAPSGEYGRVVRRSRAGAVIAIRTTGKSPAEVRNDMIEGVVRLQGLPDHDASELRERLGSDLAEIADPFTGSRISRPRSLAA